jgi:hypothetical protein
VKTPSLYQQIIFVLFLNALINSLIGAVLFWFTFSSSIVYDDNVLNMIDLFWFVFSPQTVAALVTAIDLFLFNDINFKFQNVVYLYCYMIYYIILGLVLLLVKKTLVFYIYMFIFVYLGLYISV